MLNLNLVLTCISDIIKAVQDSHAKNKERLRKEEEEKIRLQKIEHERQKEQKQVQLELEKAEKRRDVLEKKEGELKDDEERLDKDYELATRMLKNAKAQMDEAIAANDMVGVKVSRELVEAATKKLETASQHREAQTKIRVDIGKKRKIAFNKLFKSVKKAK